MSWIRAATRICARTGAGGNLSRACAVNTGAGVHFSLGGTSWGLGAVVGQGQMTSSRTMSPRLASSSSFVEQVQQVVQGTYSSTQAPPNPFELVEDDLQFLSKKLLSFISNEVPMLSNAAEYFFRSGVQGKRLRATVMLLLSSSLSVVPPAGAPVSAEWMQEQIGKQKGVAEISEMIHVASLLHDDVLDDSSTRRGIGSVNAMMGNKLAILGGDFLLARASVRLAELGSPDAVWLVATMLDHLVKGEVMQATLTPDKLLDFDQYMHKTFYKTGSLFAHSAKAVAVMGLHTPETCALAYDYGRHLGLAFQVVDDVLDFTASSGILGKPTMNDLRAGLATAPVLYAAEEFPELQPLIRRRFKTPGDVEWAHKLVNQSKGIERARALAASHAQAAEQAILDMPLPPTEHGIRCRQALIQVTQLILTRSM